MKGIYIVGGYPDRETFKKRFMAVADAGYDFIEVGLPFNDPVADGPVIAGALNEALEAGASIRSIMDDMRGLKSVRIKKYIMTYSNVVFSYGLREFSEIMKGSLDGLIIADLPNRMRPLFQAGGLTIPIIPFATLETRESDMELINSSAADFVYFVGIRGTTGSRGDLESPELLEKIRMIRSRCDKKIVIGFGIKTAGDAARAMKTGDGFVAGTEPVMRQKDGAEFEKYIRSLL